MFKEKLSKLAKKGVTIEPGSLECEEIQRSIVPPYDAGKFPNKWRKIARDQPVRTVMAHLSKDGYSHIHYDNAQARTISVREAARLQSFPDGFVFTGAMNHAFRQIGNAVPPLMARAIAVEIMKSIQPTASAHLTQQQSCQTSDAAAGAVATRLTAVAPDLSAMENAVEA